MNDRERRYVRLLRAYPKRYRQERGDEIVATMLDASVGDRDRPAGRDVVNVTAHGLQMRLGLGGDRFAGRALGLAALPGLAMAAALAVVLFVYKEWLPVATHAPIALRFGPFSTVGPVVYLVWVLATAGALLWPRRRRPLAAACIGVTLVALPVGNAFYARPNLWELLLLVGLGLPAALAPAGGAGHRARTLALATGLVTLAVLGSWEAVTGRFSGQRWWFASGYSELWRLSQAIPYVAGAAFAVIGVLLFFRWTEAAGALALLVAPWVLLGAAVPIDFPLRSSAAATVDAIAFAVLSAWFVVQWMVDVRRVHTQAAGSP